MVRCKTNENELWPCVRRDNATGAYKADGGKRVGILGRWLSIGHQKRIDDFEEAEEKETQCRQPVLPDETWQSVREVQRVASKAE